MPLSNIIILHVSYSSGLSTYCCRLLENEIHPGERHPSHQDYRRPQRRSRWCFCWWYQGESYDCDAKAFILSIKFYRLLYFLAAYLLLQHGTRSFCIKSDSIWLWRHEHAPLKCFLLLPSACTVIHLEVATLSRFLKTPS